MNDGDGAAARPGLRPAMNSRLVLWSLWSTTRALALVAFYLAAGCARRECSFGGDLARYWFWLSGSPSSGQDVSLDEYPGLAQAVIRGFSFSDSLNAFGLAWILLALVCDGLTLALLRRRAPSSAWLWLLGVFALGPVAWMRIDAFVALILVAAVSLRVSRPGVSGALTATGILLRIWPIALVPVLAVGDRVRRWAWVSMTVLLGAVVLDWTVRQERVLMPLRWQSARGIQVESLLATPMWITSVFGRPLAIERRYGADQLVDSAPWPSLIGLALLLTAVGWLSVRLFRFSQHTRSTHMTAIAQTVATAAVALAVVATNKVFSPQYVLWFMPAVALALPHLRARLTVALLAITTALATQLIYPYLYAELLAGSPAAVAILVGRNALLLTLLAVLVAEAKRATAIYATRSVDAPPPATSGSESNPLQPRTGFTG